MLNIRAYSNNLHFFRMSLFNQADEWHRTGELQSEVDQLAAIVQSLKLTREKITHLFSLMLPEFVSSSAIDNAITLPALKEYIATWLRQNDPTDIIEMCWQIAEQDSSDKVLLDEIIREHANQVWREKP